MTPAAAQTRSHRDTSATPLNVYLCPPVINACFEGRGVGGGGDWMSEHRTPSGWVQEWGGGGQMQCGTRGEEGDILSRVIDGCSHAGRLYLWRQDDPWPNPQDHEKTGQETSSTTNWTETLPSLTSDWFCPYYVHLYLLSVHLNSLFKEERKSKIRVKNITAQLKTSAEFPEHDLKCRLLCSTLTCSPLSCSRRLLLLIPEVIPAVLVWIFSYMKLASTSPSRCVHFQFGFQPCCAGLCSDSQRSTIEADFSK